jgi:LmbE family N-acetylglucosaminyl deacetylase
VGTAVFFHAHPDDETLFTGGTIARAATEGHRVVLVTATRGERGVDRAGVLAEGEALGERRQGELRDAAKRLGVSRLEFLGYQDSGIDGDDTDGFCQALAEEAAQRLAAVIADEGADVFVSYDERGIYGHPDHLKVHKVGLRAAQLSGVGSVYLATVDRDRLQAIFQLAESVGLNIEDETLDWAVTAGVARDRINVEVDVSGYMDAKRDALAAHQTQFPPGSIVFQLAPQVFQAVFGTEWYMELDGSTPRSWLWDS